MKIINEKDNRLLHRKEITYSIEENSSPTKDKLRKQISEENKTSEDNVIIERIGGNFGSRKFIVTVNVYDDAESKNKYHTITRKERKKQIEEAKKAEEEKAKAEEEAKKAAEQPKEEVKEETPETTNAEETKEEVKEETNTEEPKAEDKE